MILDDVFPQKELTFPGENAIQDDTMKQRKWKLLLGRLPRMEPQEIFRRKMDLSLPNMRCILRCYY